MPNQPPPRVCSGFSVTREFIQMAQQTRVPGTQLTVGTVSWKAGDTALPASPGWGLTAAQKTLADMS